MKFFLSLIFLTNPLSCKTTEPDQGSEVRGGATIDLYERLTTAQTPEAMAKAISERVAFLNRITREGTAGSASNCAVGKGQACSLVNIFIELGNPGTADVGHTAISVSSDVDPDPRFRNDQFYDFGPGTTENGKYKVGNPGVFSLPTGHFNSIGGGVPGTQWWDNQWRFNMTPSEIGVKEIYSKLNDLAGNQTVFRVPLCVPRGHANHIRRYWVAAYTDMPTYRIPGHQCTSMVADSFESTIKLAKYDSNTKVKKIIAMMPDPGKIRRFVTSPNSYSERIFSGNRSYYHSCGNLNGKPPKAIVINQFGEFNGPDYQDYVGWQVDRTLP
jgi:hypothetical protein